MYLLSSIDAIVEYEHLAIDGRALGFTSAGSGGGASGPSFVNHFPSADNGISQNIDIGALDAGDLH